MTYLPSHLQEFAKRGLTSVLAFSADVVVKKNIETRLNDQLIFAESPMALIAVHRTIFSNLKMQGSGQRLWQVTWTGVAYARARAR